MTTKSTSVSGSGPAKKAYEPPQLEVYGDIREIARAVGTMNMNDGAAHGNTKTS